MWKWFLQLGSPPYVYRLAGSLQWFFLFPAIALIVYGCWQGLFKAPVDYQQADAFRIIYVHVPAAYLSMMAYSIMGIASAIGLIWRMKLAHALAGACAITGASFTALALASGAIWGRPMWGTWWEWGDPRVTSELLLLFLYAGFLLLRQSIDDRAKADKAGAVLAIVGLVNIPIIHFSVEWWSSLHQGATLIRAGGPRMPPSMYVPLLYSLAGFTLLFGYLLMVRLRGEILQRESRARWLIKQIGDGARRNARNLSIASKFYWVVVLALLVSVQFGWPRSANSDTWLSEVLDSMGGYGGYVWGSFVLTALVVLWNLLHANRQRAVLQVSIVDQANLKEVS